MPLVQGTADVLTTPLAPTVVQNAQGTGAAISYQIVAVNAAGQDSIPSPATTTPANNASTPNNTISWALLPGQVQTRILKGGNLLATVGAGITSYTDSAGSSGSSYTAATANPAAFTPSANAPFDGVEATYTYTVSATAPYATPTDWIVIRGSATKTIKIKHIELSGAATAATSGFTFTINKHTVANTGGTSTNPTPIQHDSADNPATATVLLYTAAPTIAGSAAIWKTGRVTLTVVTPAAGTAAIDRYIYDYASEPYEPLTLRGVAQECAINFNGVALLAGEVLDYSITWSEV